MKLRSLIIFNNVLFSAIFATVVFFIGLFLIPQTVLAGCGSYLTCFKCMTTGLSSNCVWIDHADVCMDKNELRGYNPGTLYLTCGAAAQPQPTLTVSCSNYSTCSECLKHINDLSCIWSLSSNKCKTVDEFNNSYDTAGIDMPDSCDGNSTSGCTSYTSCADCYRHQECVWCYGGCQNWRNSSSLCQKESLALQGRCPENSFDQIPTTIPTVKVLSIPTSTSVPQKENGKTCKVNSDCLSGNCTNYVCCLKNKTCCSQSNFCPANQYCSTKNNRYYCIPKLDNGMSCTDYGQCKSNQCGKSICCGGQPCCKIDNDCGKDEYCEKKDNLYYCRVKWNIGERCEKASNCRSGYCDTYIQKCAEDPKKITPTPKKARCGDNSCDDWLGENCCNCQQDCKSVPDFCCDQNSQYAKTQDRQNKIFYLYEAPGGSIPNDRLVVPKGTNEKTFFDSYKPQICNNGKIIPGECTRSDQCVDGICVDNKCTIASSDSPQTITDKKVAEAIYNEQTEDSKEDVWVNVHDVIKGEIINSTRVEGNLEISLEVQGATAGKIPEVKVGNTVKSWLRIINNTNYSMAVVAGIVYPGQLKNAFRLEEKKYTLSCSRVSNNSLLTTIIGSANAKRLGGQYFILPSSHQLIIYSKIVPQQEGYLDVSGVVYYSKEKMYANSSLVQVNIAPVNFETSFQKTKEVSNSILVTKKKCGWLSCL